MVDLERDSREIDDLQKVTKVRMDHISHYPGVHTDFGQTNLGMPKSNF